MSGAVLTSFGNPAVRRSPGLIRLPARIYCPPGFLGEGVANFLLPGHRRLRVHPRSAVRATVRGVSVLLGTATLESSQVVTRISLGSLVLGDLRGRALIRAGYGTARSGCTLVVLEGELRMPNRLLGCGRAIRVSATGDQEVVPVPRLLLPPPLHSDDRCGSDGSETESSWMARDLEILAGTAMKPEAGPTRVSNLDGVVRDFLRREQEILQRLHALVPRLGAGSRSGTTTLALLLVAFGALFAEAYLFRRA